MKYIKKNNILLLSAVIYGMACVVLCIICNAVNSNSVFNYNIQIWNTSCQYIDFFLPLFGPIVFSTALLFRRKDRFLEYLSVRINKKKFIFQYIRNAVIATMILTTMMYYVAILYSVLALKVTPAPGNNYFFENFFGVYQAENPLVFGLIWCCWKGIIASLFTAFGCFLALYVDNIFVVIITPFIYVMAENLITGLLTVPQHSIFTSLDFNRLDMSGLSVFNYATGVLLFVLVSSLIIFVIKRRSKYVS